MRDMTPVFARTLFRLILGAHIEQSDDLVYETLTNLKNTDIGAGTVITKVYVVGPQALHRD